MELCESRTSEPCTLQAQWVVRFGNRRGDEQRSCGRHLARTCEAMMGVQRDHFLTVLRADAVPRLL